MKCRILEPIKVKLSGGTLLELFRGQLVKFKEDVAISLIRSGKILPFGKALEYDDLYKSFVSADEYKNAMRFMNIEPWIQAENMVVELEHEIISDLTCRMSKKNRDEFFEFNAEIPMKEVMF